MSDKLKNLKTRLEKYDKLCIGFSGGVDSTFLLKVAKDTIDNRVFAIIADGVMMPKRELKEAIQFANNMGVECHVLKLDALAVNEFRNNHKERCYFCKKSIFTAIKENAMRLGATHIADGKNTDDGKVYRPGAKAATELSIVSPLYEAGFSKKDIREHSKILGLPTWNKPSNACLATRFPYNTELTEDLLKRIEEAEYFFEDKGIRGVRVRLHDDIARIEVPKEYMPQILKMSDDVVNAMKKQGFKYITLDMEGFRSGSMD